MKNSDILSKLLHMSKREWLILLATFVYMVMAESSDDDDVRPNLSNPVRYDAPRPQQHPHGSLNQQYSIAPPPHHPCSPCLWLWFAIQLLFEAQFQRIQLNLRPQIQLTQRHRYLIGCLAAAPPSPCPYPFSS